MYEGKSATNSTCPITKRCSNVRCRRNFSFWGGKVKVSSQSRHTISLSSAKVGLGSFSGKLNGTVIPRLPFVHSGKFVSSKYCLNWNYNLLNYNRDLYFAYIYFKKKYISKNISTFWRCLTHAFAKWPDALVSEAGFGSPFVWSFEGSSSVRFSVPPFEFANKKFSRYWHDIVKSEDQEIAHVTLKNRVPILFIFDENSCKKFKAEFYLDMNQT